MINDQDRLFEMLASEFAGQANAAQKAEIRAWRAASSSNERLYQSSLVAWQEMDPGQAPDRFDEHDQWQVLQKRLTGSPSIGKVESLPFGKSLKKSRFRTFAALSLAALVLLGFLGLYLAKGGPFSDGLTWMRTEPGQKILVQLEDGSTVHLNGNSALGWKKGLTEDSRIMHFQGQGFFEVASEQRPFIVKTSQADISVLGTKFDVWARLAKTRVLVTEGRVRVSAGDSQSTTLQANQQVEVTDQSFGMPQRGESTDRPPWLRQRLIFRNHTLAEVVADLESWFGASIELQEPHLADLRVTGSFQDPSLETVLSEIAIALNLTYEKNTSGYLLRR